jgi:hypothetical protein
MRPTSCGVGYSADVLVRTPRNVNTKIARLLVEQIDEGLCFECDESGIKESHTS